MYCLLSSVKEYIETHGKLSHYENIQYQTIVYALTKVVDHINKNRALPNNIFLNIKSSDSINLYLLKL